MAKGVNRSCITFPEHGNCFISFDLRRRALKNKGARYLRRPVTLHSLNGISGTSAVQFFQSLYFIRQAVGSKMLFSAYNISSMLSFESGYGLCRKVAVKRTGVSGARNLSQTQKKMIRHSFGEK